MPRKMLLTRPWQGSEKSDPARDPGVKGGIVIQNIGGWRDSSNINVSGNTIQNVAVRLWSTESESAGVFSVAALVCLRSLSGATYLAALTVSRA